MFESHQNGGTIGHQAIEAYQRFVNILFHFLYFIDAALPPFCSAAGTFGWCLIASNVYYKLLIIDAWMAAAIAFTANAQRIDITRQFFFFFLALLEGKEGGKKCAAKANASIYWIIFKTWSMKSEMRLVLGFFDWLEQMFKKPFVTEACFTEPLDEIQSGKRLCAITIGAYNQSSRGTFCI